MSEHIAAAVVLTVVAAGNYAVVGNKFMVLEVLKQFLEVYHKMNILI
ncbi:hypothetical protein J4710_04595 [Staphylococcus xylosus]|uniref:Uncharacterized protein n=1 Tax=Staphylococcus xylosus TaxID=1288 RepID=A0A939NHR0_STAXY|nr:hypothetical protein [Staphylococcus xylosus]